MNMRTITAISVTTLLVAIVSFTTGAAAGFVPYGSSSSNSPNIAYHPILPAVLNPQLSIMLSPPRVLLAGENFVSGINLASSSPPGNVTFDGNNTLFGHNTLGGNVIVHGLNNIITGQTLATQQDILSSVTTVPQLPGLFAIGPPAITNTVSALNTIQNPTLFFLNVVKPSLAASNVPGVKTASAVANTADATLSCPTGKSINIITATFTSVDTTAPTCGVNVASSSKVTACAGQTGTCTISKPINSASLGIPDPCVGITNKNFIVYYTCV